MGVRFGMPPGIARTATAAALALVTLATGIVFTIRGGGNNNIIQQWEARVMSGSQVLRGQQRGYMTSSGTLVLSGSTVINDSTNSGVLLLFGYGKFCSGDVDQAGYTLCTTLNGAMTCRIGSAAECPTP